MPTPTQPTAEQIAAGVLSYDGPHDGARVLFAADVVAAILRTISNATRDPRLFEQPDEVATLLGRISAGVECLPQIAHQVATNVIGLAGQPGLHMDSLARPADDPLAHGDPRRAAMVSAAVLADSVGPAVFRLASILRGARHGLGALYVDYGEVSA